MMARRTAQVMIAVFSAMVPGGGTQAETIWYVDDDASTSGLGTSWASPFSGLQDALDAAASGDEIHVAGGTYYPSQQAEPGVARTETFWLPGDLAIYGGYAGLADPDAPDMRDPASYESILSGDLAGNDGPDFTNNDENSYHVVTAAEDGTVLRLDGLTITAGNADGSAYSGDDGGGLLVNADLHLTLVACRVTGNRAAHYGGGLYAGWASAVTIQGCEFAGNAAMGTAWSSGGALLLGSSDTSTVTGCVFTSNSAGGRGGAVYGFSDTLTMTGCVFNGNSAGGPGGAVNANSGNLVMNDCRFLGNSAATYGGGVHAVSWWPGSRLLVHCAFLGNSAQTGGGMHGGDGVALTLINCSFSGNEAVSGGGLSNSSLDRPHITNCTFTENTATDTGGGIHCSNGDGALVVAGSVLWGNSDSGGADEAAQVEVVGGTVEVNYSCIQGWTGGLGGTGNTGQDPLLMDPDGPDDSPGTADDNQRLSVGSPCIDAGDNSALIAGAGTDLDGGPRFADDPATADTGSGIFPITDMGAYEWEDCNSNDVDDGYDILLGGSLDSDDDGIPDECPPPLPTLVGDQWRYFKGVEEPPADWNDIEFDDSEWLTGPTGIGYGDDDDATVLSDMQGDYASVYVRRHFRVSEPGALSALALTVDYDDGFVAYLNGEEVARSPSMEGQGEPPSHDTFAAADHEASGGDDDPNPPEIYDISMSLGQVVAGTNVLAIQGHNRSLTSSDFSLIPSLVGDAILYVDASATGANDGSSWCDAYPALQDALAVVALSGGTIEEIRVADGEYRPDEGSSQIPGDRDASFCLRSELAIRGGYAGCGAADPDERDVTAYETVLSGDLLGDDGEAVETGPGGGMASDECAAAGPINDGETAFETTGMTTDGPTGELCEIHNDAWYVYTPEFTGYSAFRVNSSDLHAAVGVYDGTTCPPANLVGCAASWDVPPEVSVALAAGHTYLIRVGSVSISGYVSGVITIGRDTRGDNSLHVVTADLADETAVLDGFSIIAGNANGGSDSRRSSGGGMYIRNGAPTLVRCTFSDNRSSGTGWPGGGGGAFIASTSGTTMTDCVFASNFSSGGGGLFVLSGTMTMVGCTFIGNRAASEAGGVLCDYDEGTHVTAINCTFLGNSAPWAGAWLNYENADTVLVNCQFSGNSADNGGAISPGDTSRLYASNCTFINNEATNRAGGVDATWDDWTFTNCVFWGNRDAGGQNESAQISMNESATVNYSCVQGLTSFLGGVGNIGEAPLLVNALGADGAAGTEDDDLRLLAGSPCLDAADNEAVPPDATDLDGDGDTWEPIPVDPDGAPRFVDDPAAPDTGYGAPPLVDMGAYEGAHQGFLLSTDAVVVPEGDTETFTVALAMDPLEGVEVTVAYDSGDADITVASGALLIFDSLDYAEPQVVTLAAGEDADDVHGAARVCVSASGFSTVCVSATERDSEAQTIVYVDADASGDGDGTSWADAFSDLQDALAAAGGSTVIRVAQGVYQPDLGAGQIPGDRDATFGLMNGVKLEGGYAGCGAADPDERDIEGQASILSGDLSGNDVGDVWDPSRGENAYHVVTASGTDSSAVLDGFVVTGGNADGIDPAHDRGGGMYSLNSSPALANCTLAGNAGAGCGGLFNAASSPVLTNCAIDGNTSYTDGAGGVYNDSGSVATLRGCVISSNAVHDGAAAILNEGTLVMTDCLLGWNDAYEDTGGVLNLGLAMLRGCTFVENSGNEDNGNAGGLTNYGTAILTDCTFTGNWHVWFGAIYSSGDLSLVNSVLCGNSGFTCGGLGIEGGTASVADSTICANAGGGVGVAFSGDLNLVNSILWGNTGEASTTEFNQLAASGSGGINVTYTCIEGLDSYTGEGVIGTDPLFVDPGHLDDGGTTDPWDDVWTDGDFRLQPTSSCIEAGNNDALPSDIFDLNSNGDTSEPIPHDRDGNPRLVGCLVDLGSYEYQGQIIQLGDFDDDCLITLDDYRYLEVCLWLSGPGGDPGFQECRDYFDYDDDSDVDLADVAGFQRVFTGS